MEAKQHLYYALGILLYAIAKADGKIQREEEEAIQKVLKEELDHDIDFNYTSIIFELLKKDNLSNKNVYDWALHSFELGKHHFTEELKQKFIKIISFIAASYPPITDSEQQLINQFLESLKKLEVKNVI